jgi:ABC-2 type transport system permease protein
MTTTTLKLDYKPTTMQKLLGRNYKWWYSIVYNFKLAYSYKWNILLAIIRFFIPLIVTYIILSLSSAGKGYNEYLLIGSIFYQFYAYIIGPSFDITNQVIKGELTKYLLRPSNYFLDLIMKIIGFNSLTLFFRVSIIVIFCLITGLKINFNLNTLIAVLCIFFTLILGYLIEVIVGSLVFFQYEINKALLPFYYDLMPFLTGSLISFSLSPYLNVFKFTPLSLFAYHPMQIYLGKYNSTETLLVFVGGIIWCIILYFLAKFVFKKGLKRNEAVGL